MSCYLTSPAVEAQVQSIVAAEAPDIVLIDAMFPAALAQAAGLRSPVGRVRPHLRVSPARHVAPDVHDPRRHAPAGGFRRTAAARRSVAATRAHHLDQSRRVRRARPCLVGTWCAMPVRCSRTRNSPCRPRCPGRPSDPTPLVLVSFSTGFEQRNVDKVQRALDALADLPVHVVATTGGIVAPNEVGVAPQCRRAQLCGARSDHAARRSGGDPWRPRHRDAHAAAWRAHGRHSRARGRSTVRRRGRAEWGCGRALPGDASMDAIRAAAHDVLSTPSFKENAKRRSTALAGVDGAANAADEVETLLQADARGGSARHRRQVA